jgi:FAD dependent oxidoreductase TIGR03364
MLAYTAERRGCEVVQLEREAAARGASIRNFGLIWVSGRRPGDELTFALRSRQLWAELASELPDVGFRANGSLTLVQSEAELAVLVEVMLRGDAQARGFELLDADAVREANPAVRGEVLAGLLCTTDAAVEPRRVPRAVRAKLTRSPRYEWHPNTHVVEVGAGFARDQRGVEYRGDLVLVCVGAAYRSVLGADGEAAPLRRVRLQMLETEPYPKTVLTSLADADSLRYYPAFTGDAQSRLPPPSPLVAEHRLQLLLQQRLDGRLTIGDTHAYDEPFEVGVDEVPYEHLVARAESILGSSLPAVTRRWAGVYAQAVDDRLFLFEQVAHRCHVVNGAGGRGMTLSPAIAERVLDGLGIGAQSATASSTSR